MNIGKKEPSDARGLLDKDWIILKGNWGDRVKWFKLKSVQQSRLRMIGKELSGADIQCVDEGVSKWEKRSDGEVWVSRISEVCLPLLLQRTFLTVVFQ